MSLRADLFSVTSKQYGYKLKAYISWVYGLILLQIMALLFSFGGIGSMSSGNGELNVSVKYYSADTAIGFTLLWMFFIATRLTTKSYKNMDFTLVTNRVSSHLSNIGFLLTASIFGGMTSSLMSVLLKVIMYFTFDRSQIAVNGFHLAYSELLFGIATTALYMFLIAAISYFIGMLVQANLLFSVVIPAVIFGLARVNPQALKYVLDFFASEVSPARFAVKTIVTSIAFFCFSILLSNRMEVRK